MAATSPICIGTLCRSTVLSVRDGADAADPGGEDETGASADTPAQRLAARLIVDGSGFARSASRGVTRGYSLVAMRTLSSLERDGGLRVGELARREGIAQPSMTGVVNGLERAGLVTRTADPRDARAAIVTVTEAGLAELWAFRHRTAANVTPLIEALPSADRAALTRAAELLEQLSAQLRDT